MLQNEQLPNSLYLFLDWILNHSDSETHEMEDNKGKLDLHRRILNVGQSILFESVEGKKFLQEFEDPPL